MSSKTDWLQSEIKTWVSEGLIDRTTGQLLAERYPSASGKSWGVSLLTAIGAIIFGLGVILFFAYNWDDLPKFAKLTMIFLSLIGFHLLGWYCSVRSLEQRNLSEGFHLIGTMMFGAGIFLIAQIYHLNEHYPVAILVWGVGALLFAWALPSVIQGIIAACLISVWGFSEIIDFSNLHFYSAALVFFGVLPLAWLQRSTVLLFIGLVATIALLLLNAGIHVDEIIVFYALFTIAVILIAISYVVRNTRFPRSVDVLRVTGVVIYGLFVFALTFDWGILDFSIKDGDTLERIVIWGLLGIATVVWVGMCLFGLKAKFEVTKSMQHGLILLTVLLLFALTAQSTRNSGLPLNLLFDAILAVHCILLIIRGTDNLKWKQVALGCVVLATLVFARFNDLFESLLMRSLVFLLLGAMLFFIGHMYSRSKLRKHSNA